VHDAWIEVDVKSLRYNVQQVKTLLAPSVKLMAVVKGHGFGHGYAVPARAFVAAGAEYLAVTRIEEAIPIREAGIQVRTLLFAPIQPENADDALALNLDITVENVQLATAISAAAARRGVQARVHMKIDSGMSRLGMLPDEFPAAYAAISRLPAISVAGVYTHFAEAGGKDPVITKKQNERFHPVVQNLRMQEQYPPIIHAANSAAFLRFPETRYNMVRIGTLLYGQYPGGEVPRKLTLENTWRLRARICSIKTLPRGSRVGYGGEFITQRPTRIAIIPIGYADGYTMAAEGSIYRQSPAKLLAKKYKRQPTVELHGKPVPVIGRVSMQMTALDVTDCLEVSVGDVVNVPALRLATNPELPHVYIDNL
jgi:alanine racemase